MPKKPLEKTSAPTTNRRLPTWKDLKRKIKDYAYLLIILSPVLIPVLTAIIYVPCYRASLKSAEFTVDRRERVTTGSGDGVKSYFLVWSKEGEVFCVADSWSFLRFDSSDRYGKLREASHVTARVAGWRIPFFSWYRNVLVIESTIDKQPLE